MGCMKWVGGAVAGVHGNAVDACGLDRFGEGHGRQDGGVKPLGEPAVDRREEFARFVPLALARP